MSGPEIKHTLRKTEFPVCAREALLKTAHLICGRVPSIKHMDLALDLIAEFIFCEIDRRGNKRADHLTPILELELLDVLFDYFNGSTSEASKNTIFLSLFSGTMASLRLPVLSKLVSIAIGAPSPSVLISASAWMQQLGNTSVNSCRLAEAIVKDYFVLVPEATQRLKTLPHLAPQFTANFLTAMAEIYYADNKKEPMLFPPHCLLEMVTFWISDNNKLCIAAQQLQSALPPGAIAMEATTPLAGLLKWCVLAPLYQQNSELYSQLHLSLLHGILEIPSSTPPRAVSAQHLAAHIAAISRYIANLHSKCKSNSERLHKVMSDKSLQLSLDRFAQAVQVSLFVNCVYGNVDDLMNQIQQLPPTKLFKIIVSTYKQNK